MLVYEATDAYWASSSRGLHIPQSTNFGQHHSKLPTSVADREHAIWDCDVW